MKRNNVIPFVGRFIALTIFLAIQINFASGEKKNFIVHEWGIFEVNKNNFIRIGMPGGQVQKIPPGIPATRKPIIYFYSQEPLRIRVKVKFPYGNPAQTLPQAQYLGNSIKWRVKILENEKSKVERNSLFDEEQEIKKARKKLEQFRRRPLQSITDEDWVEIAREVKSNTIKVNMQKEKFLFYDGILRNYEFDVLIDEEKSSRTGSVFSIENDSENDIYDILIIKKEDEQYEIGTLSKVKSERSAKVKTEVIKEGEFQSKGSKILKKALIKAGLYKDEAESVIEIWIDKFFNEEKEEYTYLIYRITEEEYNKLLPIKIKPAPKEIKRVGLVWIQQ